MKRVSIVFAETDDKNVDAGQGFNVFLEGVDIARLRSIPEEQWTAAEFWAVKCFNILVNQVLRPSGLITSEEPVS